MDTAFTHKKLTDVKDSAPEFGLGEIQEARFANGDLDTRLVFACVLVLTLLGLVFFFAIEAMEKVFVRWHVSARQAEAAASGE